MTPSQNLQMIYTKEVHATVDESNESCQHIPTNGDLLNTAGKKMVHIYLVKVSDLFIDTVKSIMYNECLHVACLLHNNMSGSNAFSRFQKFLV